MAILKLALTYTFKGKDKLVLGLNYFSLFCICLTISTLIVVLSLTNGFIEQVAYKMFRGLYVGDEYKVNLIVYPKIELEEKSNKIPLLGLQKMNELNYNVVVPDSVKNLVVGKKIEYQIGMGRSVVDVGTSKNSETKLAYLTTPDAKLPAGTIELCSTGFWGDKWELLNFQLASIDSVNPLTGLPRFKNFTLKNIVQTKESHVAPFGGPCIVRVDPKTFSILFDDKIAYLQTYQINNLWKTPEIVDAFEAANPDYRVVSWVISPHFFSAMQLQKKIISVVYLMIITLVGALVLSVNISFYKDRRKDWALLEMLNISRFAVEKILALRAFIMFTLCALGGSALGVIISLKINTILDTLGVGAQQASNVIFGVDKLQPSFNMGDFLMVNAVVLFAYFVTYIVQLWAYKTNSPAVLLKQGA